MRRFGWAILGASVIAVVCLTLWFRGTPSAPIQASSQEIALAAASPAVPDDTPATNPNPPVVPSPKPPPPAAPTWEEELNDVLASANSDDAKAARLLTLLSRVNTNAQETVAQHLVNFLADDHFADVGPILTNAHSSENILRVLMTDLLRRADAVKLPLALAVAATENHPFQDEAQNLLKIHLGEDYGTNWNTWQDAITAKLTGE